MRDQEQWINEIKVLLPAKEVLVSISYVGTENGVYTAQAEVCGQPIKIGWISNTNDHPVDGQQWLVRVLGCDIPTGVWLAQALIRES